GAHLLQEAEIHQPVESLGDAPVEVGRVMADPDQADRCRRIALEAGAERREWPTGTYGHLQGPYQSAPVGGLDTAGRHRVELGEAVVQGREGRSLLPTPLGASTIQSGGER